MKLLKSVIGFVMIGLISFSCTPGNPPNTVTSPGPANYQGSELDATYIAAFEPQPAVGMKYVYVSSVTGAANPVTPQETSTEILAIEGNSVKVRIIGGPEGTQEKTMARSDLAATGVTNAKFIHEGLVDVIVPAGEYKGATKVSSSVSGSKLTLWLASGVGVVKSTLAANNGSTLVTELKEFKEN